MDRPREKLRYRGAGAVSDAELLAILLGSGSRFLPLMTICDAILDLLDHDLKRLSEVSIEDLCRIKGVGETTALRLLASLELAARICRPVLVGPELKTEAAVAGLVWPYFEGVEKRGFILVLLDERRILLATCELLLNEMGLPDIDHLVKIIAESGAVFVSMTTNHLRFSGQEEDFLRNVLPAAIHMLGAELEYILVIGKNGLLNFSKLKKRSPGPF